MKKKVKSTWELIGGKGKGAFTPEELMKSPKKSTVKAKRVKPSK